MKRDEIIDAYLLLRKNNKSIPDDTIDFMKASTLRAYDEMEGLDCKHCEHDGNQAIFNTACTGCGIEEKRHFKYKSGK